MSFPGKQLILLILGVAVTLVTLATIKASPLGRPVINPTEPYQELTASLNDLQTEKAVLEDQVSSLRRQLKTAEADALIARSELQKLHALEEAVGLTIRKGPGVIITLEDIPGGAISNDVPEEVCHAANLRDIVNLLRLAGAKAISINGQRVLLSTTTVCIENGVLINSTKSLAPYFIRALGEPDQLHNFLLTKHYLPEIHRRRDQGNLKLTITNSADLVIPEFKGQLTTKEVRPATTAPPATPAS